LRGNSYNSVTDQPDETEAQEPRSEKEVISARAAQERAQHVAATVLGSHSAPVSGSRRSSIISDADTVNSGHGLLSPPRRESIRLRNLTLKLGDAQHDGTGDDWEKSLSQQQKTFDNEALNLVRCHTIHHNSSALPPLMPSTAPAVYSAPVTPTEEREAELYVPPPQQYRGSILSSLLSLYKQPEALQSPSPGKNSSGFTTPGDSGTATPTRKKWYDKDKNRSTDTLANLTEASLRLADVGHIEADSPTTKQPKRPKHKRSASSRLLNLGRPQSDEVIRITINIAEILSRQKYIVKMCRALMMYGAPTHRLEEYLTMTARVLEIEGHFLYLPGCMIISFDDSQTHTTEVKIVRTNQGIDLGKLKDTHEIYKSVLHDLYGVDEAMDRLSKLMDAKDKFHPWLRVLVFGIASAAVAPFAFGGRWIDLPICFLLGCIVGVLQIIAAPKSALYNNLFEISATVLTSFLSRAFGSIKGGELFCFSALAQSSIALILPGWIVCKLGSFTYYLANPN
jgi:uncharacterized membrane protein YjjP (DUF1212 family)